MASQGQNKWKNGDALNNVNACLGAIASGADVNDPRAGPKGPPLIVATTRARADVVEVLLAHGATPDVVGISEFAEHREVTALIEAVLNANADICKLLLEAGADPNLRDQYGEAPLQHAMANYNAPICKLLVGHGARVNDCSAVGGNFTALHCAVDRFNERAVIDLLSMGADPSCLPDNAQEGHKTAFMAAAEQGDEGLLQIMFDTGRVDPLMRAPCGATALSLCENPSEAYDRVLELQEAFLSRETARGVSEVLSEAAGAPDATLARKAPSMGMI